MFTAKDIQIKVIDSASSRKIVERYHYSGKCMLNRQIHFGVFLNKKLQGALQFGSSIDKRRMAQNLGIGFNESLELNRMALSDNCPKNSESRSLGICLRLLKKTYPHLKIIISFADACQCGDGTIYRASGFKLHSYKKNSDIMKDHKGNVAVRHGTQNLRRELKNNGYDVIDGFQMKYLFFFDKELEKKFKFIDFDKIPDYVKMYKGKKRVEHESNASNFQLEESGAVPTNTLQLNE